MSKNYWRYYFKATAVDGKVVTGKLIWPNQIMGTQQESLEDYAQEYLDACEYLKCVFVPTPSQAPHVLLSGGAEWPQPPGRQPTIQIDEKPR